MLAVRALAVLVLVLVPIGCGGGDPGPVESSPDPRRNVLVIDDGFDLPSPVFAGRVAAAYSIVCPHAAAVATDDAAAPDPTEVDAGAPSDGGAGGLAQRKADLITALRIRDTLCHLETGVEPKPDPLAAIARYRDRWNRAILASKYASTAFSASEIDEIQKAQSALSKARFHGTATAGLIAHSNPGVRLVLVEELLGSAEAVMTDFTCFEQQSIDDNVALFSDPEVRQAYVDRPSSQLDDDFRALQARHQIGVLNESFGSFSRQELETLQARKGCPAVDLRRYLALLGELDAARALAHPDPDALLVKSAGNDHSQLDGPEDHPMCAMAGGPRLIVGAYDDTGQLTDFTNFGLCVDAVAPGWRIIAPIPGGWYLPLSGTSFSAPLTVRLVSVAPQPVPFTPEGARAAVLSMRDGARRIPIGRFPRELLYDPDKLANQWALRLSGEPVAPEQRLYSLRRLRALQSLFKPGR